MNDEFVMTRRSKIWRVAGAAFVFINAGGAVLAVASGESMHAVVHVVLLAGGYVAWRLASRGREQDRSRAQQADPGLEYLQQSVDAIALEVERIGEAQRYNEKLRAELGETSPPKKDQ